MSKILPIHPKNPEMRKICQAIEALKVGAVIAYPTDTAYALGCDLQNKNAIELLYQIKRMPHDHLLTLLCLDLSELSRYVVMDNPVYRTVRHLLPGPYTCIFSASREVPKKILPQRKQVGVRIPNTPILHALLQELGNPILSTTANNAEGNPIQWPEEISKSYPRLHLVIDGGPGGLLPTTILDFTQTPPLLVRQGAGPVDFL